ncbi:MAG: TetR/AcrR family transcriptional regulator [Chloroflexi bacterium]|nr:MAG: TetR/AcrR family transcriptional regulator [Chloroflexota bacterium]
MPKETFFNLPEEKRQQILNVAIDEFATNTYAQASVNRIVEKAGIAKGSFYQYFKSKKDLFLYLMQVIGEEKMTYLAPTLQNIHQYDFFTCLREIYAAGIRFATQYPKYAEIGKKLLASKDTPIFEELVDQNLPVASQLFQELLHQAIQRGEIRPDIDINLIAYLIASINTTLLEYYTENINQEFDEKILNTVEKFIDLLRNGIGTK